MNVQTLEMMLINEHYSLKKLISILIVIIATIGQCKSSVLIYNTENSRDAGEANCIFYEESSTVKYCVRSNPIIVEARNMTVCVHGKKWHFSELLEKRISPWHILSWSSSVEKADVYARLFYNHSETLEEDPFLCNCNEGYFGKSCEYALIFDPSSFGKNLQRLFRLYTSPRDYQIWGEILCYETLQCDYGMLCLDWRNICDGQQNCMNGIDEENCDLLEFNECEDNEYRCIDGMCIPEEYWLDGKGR